jgi:nucleoside-diphosphate-sugar epimerase
MKTVIGIIGASSMLGKELKVQLLKNDNDVVTIGRSTENDILFDLKNKKNIDQCSDLKLDVIFFCASSFANDSEEGIEENILTNTLGANNVLSFAKATGCKNIIYAGSLFSIKGVERSNSNSSYGLSKLFYEELLSGE